MNCFPLMVSNRNESDGDQESSTKSNFIIDLKQCEKLPNYKAVFKSSFQLGGTTILQLHFFYTVTFKLAPAGQGMEVESLPRLGSGFPDSG